MNIVVTKRFSKDVEIELNKQQKQELKVFTEIPDCKKMKGYKNAYPIKFGDFRIGFLWEDEANLVEY